MEPGKARFIIRSWQGSAFHSLMPIFWLTNFIPLHRKRTVTMRQGLPRNCVRNCCRKGAFCFETVFSHSSKIDFVAQAKALGYKIILVLIHLDNVSLNQARIYQRVSEGGHSVPDEKVRSRVPRLLKLIKQTLPLCDQCGYSLNAG